MMYEDGFVGLRVVVNADDVDGLDIHDRHGQIIKINEDNDELPFLVKFDEHFSDDLHSTDRNCWWVHSYDVEIESISEDEDEYIESNVDYSVFDSIIG